MVATGEVPLTWTEAMIIPLYKSKGDAAMPTNYRAIVITDIISKVFDRLTTIRVTVGGVNRVQIGGGSG